MKKTSFSTKYFKKLAIRQYQMS